MCSQHVFVCVIVIVFVFVFVFVNFFGHVMFSHHSEQMSQRSQVSRMALRRGSQNVFVFVIVFVFVFVFVFVNEEDNGIGDVRYVKFLGILFSTTVSL